jgi:hypothetical protein
LYTPSKQQTLLIMAPPHSTTIWQELWWRNDGEHSWWEKLAHRQNDNCYKPFDIQLMQHLPAACCWWYPSDWVVVVLWLLSLRRANNEFHKLRKMILAFRPR